MTEYYIYLNAPGACDDPIIFKNIFEKTTKLKNFEFTNDIEKANVLLEAVFNSKLYNVKSWKYKILWSPEPWINDTDNYDLILFSKKTEKNIVDYPFYVYYLHTHHNTYNLLNRLIERPLITKVPEKFCCFIVSNGDCKVRNNMFHYLNNYKKVESLGRYCNNMNFLLEYQWWTDEFRNYISNYKFIICFENSKICEDSNTYSTEKIVNPYIAGTIPIYWGSNNIHKVLSRNSMLFLEDESIESYQKIINEIIELDNDNEKYLEFVNRPVITDLTYYNENYTIEALAAKIDNVL